MKDLASLREEIDQLDEQLWEIIGKRADVARQIGVWKRLHSEQVLQPQRYEQVLKHCQQKAIEYNLPPEMVEKIMQIIHDESVKIQS
ncbi:MAG: chorismate mutase [Paludibacteraceae bacterium]|nr:chorismate mutase [Paludibacteraceae bacterium]